MGTVYAQAYLAVSALSSANESRLSSGQPDSTARFEFCGFGVSASQYAKLPKYDRTIVIYI
jgi:hypothetical protein